jgi:hypothetical protein
VAKNSNSFRHMVPETDFLFHKTATLCLHPLLDRDASVQYLQGMRLG